MVPTVIHCHKCGALQPALSSKADRLEHNRVLLACAAVQLGMALTIDDRVSEPDAAKLLSLKPAGLKNLREKGIGPSWHRRGVGGYRVSYTIADLAEWLEAGRVETTSTHSRR